LMIQPIGAKWSWPTTRGFNFSKIQPTKMR
jgi:hypothetical protein